MFAGRPWTHLWRADDLPVSPGDWPAATAGSPDLILQAGQSYVPGQSTAAYPSLADVDPGLVDQGADAVFSAGYVWIGTGLVIPGLSRVHYRIAGIASPSGQANAMHWLDAGSSTQQIHRIQSGTDGSVASVLFSGGGIVSGDEVDRDISALIADLVIEVDGSSVLLVNGARVASSLSLSRPDTDGTIRALFRSFGRILGIGINVGGDASWISDSAHTSDVTAVGLDTISLDPVAVSTGSAPPAEIDRGVSADWAVDLGEYTPAGGWAYRWIMSSGADRLEATVSDSGAGWVVSIGATQSAALAVGRYDWRAYVESGALRFLVGSGSILVRPSALDAATDLRSSAQISLDAIEAVLARRATRDQEEMSFNGRSLVRMSIDDLMKLRAHYAYRVRIEANQAGGRSGGSKILVAFR